MSIPISSNPSKILRLFADLQDRLYEHNTVKNAITQICNHTKDQNIIKTCQTIADILDIELNFNFNNVHTAVHFQAVQQLHNHQNHVISKYQEIKNNINNYNPKWTAPLLEIIDTQIARLSQLIILLDREPDICDNQGSLIRPNDLVIYPCKDENDRDYEHYGIVRATPNGYRVAHFFTGKTVKPEGKIVSVGIGYIHFAHYSPEWLFKERPEQENPHNSSDLQTEMRIQASREKILNSQDPLWNLLNYNCEHWAREMVYGEAKSTQVLDKRNNK
ncbi:hypothetical protein [Nostoc sp. FACHB-190]|uniref:hypothetical protein n=1 Tax=Nostoc sp. FACHB-190 TaxID=2692838 RepID=UPI001686F675|nr:hypothetical protein [Nostoc sp. FACHB-190]MBD2300158.1 hypothetical protein [Nostoc sp. FACHB-190]